MELDSIEELNRLEKQIQETQKFLEKNTNDQNFISTLKRQRIITSILAFLFLLFGLWSFFFNKEEPLKKNDTTSISKPDFMLIHKDTIKLYQDFYTNRRNLSPEVSLNSNLNSKVVYYVQFAALKGVNTDIIESMKIKHQYNNGYSKLLVGDFGTYEEALDLRYHLKKFGFKDCFVTAQSFGKNISIKKAVALSKEKILINK